METRPTGGNALHLFWANQSRSGEEAGQVRGRGVEPVTAGRGVGPEHFEVAFLLVVEHGTMQTQLAGLGIVAQAGGIVRAHLEQDAHLKFTHRLAAQESVHVVVRIARGDDVEAVAGAIADDGR